LTHTELIKLILKELDKNGISLHKQKEIHNELMPNEKFERFRANWSNWINSSGQKINNADAKRSIAKNIGFENHIWDSDTNTQIEAIKKAVKKYVRSKKDIDISDFLPTQEQMSDEQFELLVKIKDISNEDIEQLIKESDFLKPLSSNQDFLIHLIKVLYQKGMYEFIESSVYPNILLHNAQDRDIKILMANIYGSLNKPKYKQAQILLDSIEFDNDSELADARTMLISNIRRELFANWKNMQKEDIIELLRYLKEHYKYTFVNIDSNYYTGINLAYILTILYYISPNNPHIDLDDIKEILKDSKESIDKDRFSKEIEKEYFARVSEIEFKTLLNEQDSIDLLYSLLTDCKIDKSFKLRTVRYIEFVSNIIEDLSVRDAKDLIQRLKFASKQLMQEDV